MSIAATPRGYIERPRPSGLADVIDVILDKGLVIDVYVRVALIGIEILTIDARIVIASVDTYLRFAEAVNRLDISQNDQAQGLPQPEGELVAEPELIYVYGVSAASQGKRELGKGIEGSPVLAVEHAGLAALTTPLARRSLSPGDVRSHWRVLERAFEEGTVLPLR